MYASEQRAQLIVDSALDAVVTTGDDGRILSWNRGAEEMFGWSAEDAIGRTVPETVLPPDRIDSYLSTIAMLGVGAGVEGVRREGSAQHRSGRVFPVEVSITAMQVGETWTVLHFVRDVSKEKAAAEALREKNELLVALLDGVPIAINMIDADARVTLWNSAAERVFGWTSAEAIGRVLPNCGPAELEEVHARLPRTFAGEIFVDIPARALHRDGTAIDVSLSVMPIYGQDGTVVGSMGMTIDVTEQKRAAEALLESNQLLNALLDASPLPITAIDLEGRSTLWNSAAERTFGWTAEEAVGAPLPIIPLEEREAWAALHARVIGGEALTDVHARVVHCDGARRNVSLSAAPIYGPDGQVTGSIEITVDITERLRAFELLRKGDQERRMLLAKLLLAQEEERARIAADIHDDSVQVLTALALRLELLRRRTDDPIVLESLAEAEKTARLAITRLRHLMFELRPPALDRDGLAAALRLQLAQTRLDFGVEYELVSEIAQEPQEETRALVYRIAQEAIATSVKHARAKRVSVRLRNVEHGLVVTITDDGRGCEGGGPESPGQVALVAMRERAEMAGGWFTIESTPETGTVVEFAVPFNGSAMEGPK